MPQCRFERGDGCPSVLAPRHRCWISLRGPLHFPASELKLTLSLISQLMSGFLEEVQLPRACRQWGLLSPGVRVLLCWGGQSKDPVALWRLEQHSASPSLQVPSPGPQDHLQESQDAGPWPGRWEERQTEAMSLVPGLKLPLLVPVRLGKPEDWAAPGLQECCCSGKLSC